MNCILYQIAEINRTVLSFMFFMVTLQPQVPPCKTTNSLTLRFLLLSNSRSSLPLACASFVCSSTSPHFRSLFRSLFQGMSGTAAMHGIQPGVSCSPAGPCENMNVSFDECPVVTFRRGLGFVTLSCHLHLVDIFWP